VLGIALPAKVWTISLALFVRLFW